MKSSGMKSLFWDGSIPVLSVDSTSVVRRVRLNRYRKLKNDLAMIAAALSYTSGENAQLFRWRQNNAEPLESCTSGGIVKLKALIEDREEEMIVKVADGRVSAEIGGRVYDLEVRAAFAGQLPVLPRRPRIRVSC